MSASPVVSVVIPSRNGGAAIEPTLHTILAQGPDLEIVLVDDGSTDETAAIATRVGRERLRVIRHHESQGVADARNSGAAEASGRWVAFCDDDDLWHPDKLTLQLEALTSNPSCRWSSVGEVVVDTNLTVIDWKLTVEGTSLQNALAHGNAIPGSSSSVVVERSLFEELGGFTTEFAHLADWDLWIRLGQVSEIAHVPAPLMLYIQSPHQMSAGATKTASEWASFRALHDQWRASQGVEPGDAIQDLWIATVARRHRQHGKALRHYLRVALQRQDPALATFARSVIGQYVRHRGKPARPPSNVAQCVREVASVAQLPIPQS